MKESTLNIAIDRIRKALGEIGEVNDDIFTLLLLSATRIDRLTEQLRLANEDAERLAEYVGHKRTCTWAVVRSDVTPKCDCGLSDAVHLHEQLRKQE